MCEDQAYRLRVGSLLRLELQDKQVPCSACVKRKAAHNCRVDASSDTPIPANQPSSLKPQSTPITNECNDNFRMTVYAEIDVLRRRVYELENLHARVASLESGRSAQDEEAPPERVKAGSVLGSDFEQDAAVTLEFFALGADRRPDLEEGQQGVAGLSRPSTPVRQVLCICISQRF